MLEQVAGNDAAFLAQVLHRSAQVNGVPVARFSELGAHEAEYPLLPEEHKAGFAAGNSPQIPRVPRPYALRSLQPGRWLVPITRD